jgi:hypothetical protein
MFRTIFTKLKSYLTHNTTMTAIESYIVSRNPQNSADIDSLIKEYYNTILTRSFLNLNKP